MKQQIRVVEMLVAAIILTLCQTGGADDGACAMPQKRLIGHGWDLLAVSPTEVARHADELAKTGLDGVSLSLRAKLPDGKHLSFSSILTDPPWDVETFRKEIEAMRTLRGKPGVSHCYLSAFWTPAKRLAWNDDQAWARAIGNMRTLARIAREGEVEGLLIDPEDYSESKQFRFQPVDGDFGETFRLARKRGAQFIEAVAAEHPNARLLFFWLLSLSYQDFSTGADPESVLKARGDLWPAFVNGMLDKLPETMLLIDGDERAYRYEASRGDFYKAAWQQKQGMLPVVDEKNRRKLKLNVSTGSGHYLDSYVVPTNSFWYLGPVNGSRLNHLAENLQQAVCCAEDCIWLYGEKNAWVKWRGVKSGSWDSDRKSFQTWEEALPGFSVLLQRLRNPRGWIDRRIEQLKREGKLVNLFPNSDCVYPEPLEAGKYHAKKRLKQFAFWQDEKKRQGTFGVDTGVGFGDTSSISIKGCGNACFIYDAPPAKQGTCFLVRYCTKGARPSTAVYWKRGGAWDWSVPGCFPISIKPCGDGWSRGEIFVQVPARVDSFALQLGAKLGAEEQIWYDKVEIYSLD
ncbi:MAG: hypothetical protein IKR48_12760 [Kiritimatiellae bacterium]|nr:hypothetical protein [Kiritimatiellia bacterium]